MKVPNKHADDPMGRLVFLANKLASDHLSKRVRRDGAAEMIELAELVLNGSDGDSNANLIDLVQACSLPLEFQQHFAVSEVRTGPKTSQHIAVEVLRRAHAGVAGEVDAFLTRMKELGMLPNSAGSTDSFLYKWCGLLHCAVLENACPETILSLLEIGCDPEMVTVPRKGSKSKNAIQMAEEGFTPHNAVVMRGWVARRAAMKAIQDCGRDMASLESISSRN